MSCPTTPAIDAGIESCKWIDLLTPTVCFRASGLSSKHAQTRRRGRSISSQTANPSKGYAGCAFTWFGNCINWISSNLAAVRRTLCAGLSEITSHKQNPLHTLLRMCLYSVVNSSTLFLPITKHSALWSTCFNVFHWNRSRHLPGAGSLVLDGPLPS